MTLFRKIATVALIAVEAGLGLPPAGMLLLFGTAELIHPDVPASYLVLNVFACLGAILIGLAILFGMGFLIRRQLAAFSRPAAAAATDRR